MSTSGSGLQVHDLDCGILSQISLTVRPGEIVCLSGPSGSGKSRLLRAIADLDPHAGEIRLDGEPQTDVPAYRWRRRVMLLPAEAPWWLERVGAHFPDGPDAAAFEALGLPADAPDWPVTRLSSGERQRAALLRAVAREPRALLLDEPTANLDATTTEQVEAWLRQRIADRGIAALWVAHDMAQIARVADAHLRITEHRLEPAPCRSSS
ncbi:ABC transporter ATP-binding protein [Aquisalimonas lutea]|uniref:ABC transporter ATP-binding protein n=1 Tax=Aquisalimonas lutea TaxID=1327750 RepID=UPI0025B2EE28|nr:ABC transporter ATP-binding protein [Aquisalimonas lutea]MDN3516293.1 ABC transporter ATP-binding protein [Aquisalimonas lutea]